MATTTAKMTGWGGVIGFVLGGAVGSLLVGAPTAVMGAVAGLILGAALFAWVGKLAQSGQHSQRYYDYHDEAGLPLGAADEDQRSDTPPRSADVDAQVEAEIAAAQRVDRVKRQEAAPPSPTAESDGTDEDEPSRPPGRRVVYEDHYQDR